jgi:hypothetical protein
MDLIRVGQSACWKQIHSITRRWGVKGYRFLPRASRQYWICALVVIYGFARSYFVRELVGALLFFTVIYFVLVIAVVVFILMDHAIRLSTAWAMSACRAFSFWRVHDDRRAAYDGGSLAPSASSARRTRSTARSRLLVRLQIFWSAHAGRGY